MNKIRNASVALSVFAMTLVLTASIASASPPPDPTGTAAEDLTDQVTDWVTTYGIPMILALFVLGVGLKLFLKFGRKATNAVG